MFLMVNELNKLYSNPKLDLEKHDQNQSFMYFLVFVLFVLFFSLLLLRFTQIICVIISWV